MVTLRTRVVRTSTKKKEKTTREEGEGDDEQAVCTDTHTKKHSHAYGCHCIRRIYAMRATHTTHTEETGGSTGRDKKKTFPSNAKLFLYYKSIRTQGGQQTQENKRFLKKKEEKRNCEKREGRTVVSSLTAVLPRTREDTRQKKIAS